MVTKGIRDLRIGTREAVCEILATIRQEEATDALLDRLREDSSRFVRLQCLRSLVAPGRSVDWRRLADAMASESDPELLALKAQFLSRGELEAIP